MGDSIVTLEKIPDLEAVCPSCKNKSCLEYLGYTLKKDGSKLVLYFCKNPQCHSSVSYESILKMATERATREANRAEKAVIELQVWKDRVEMLETRMKGLEQENLLYRGWSERLCHQLSSLGAAPVPLIPKEEKKKS